MTHEICTNFLRSVDLGRGDLIYGLDQVGVDSLQ
jgi:hypothetical protein